MREYNIWQYAVDVEINEELIGPPDNRFYKVIRSEQDEDEFRASLARDVSPMEEICTTK